MNTCHLCPNPAPQGEPLCAACFDAAFERSWNDSVERLKDPRRITGERIERDTRKAQRYMAAHRLTVPREYFLRMGEN